MKKVDRIKHVKERLENYITKLHTAIAEVIMIENSMDEVILPYLKENDLLDEPAIKAMVDNINTNRKLIAEMVATTKPFKEIFGEISIVQVKIKGEHNGVK